MQFTENIFAQQLSHHLSDEEKQLLDKVVSALSPTPTFLNIAHQLRTLLVALTNLSTLNLPNAFQENNNRIIALLTKVVAIEAFKKRTFLESPDHSKNNPIYGNIKDFPVATLFSLSFNMIEHENTKQVFYCAVALTFWLSFNGALATKVDGKSKLVRKFIEKNKSLKLNTNIASLTLQQFIRKWDDLLFNKGFTGTIQNYFAQQAQALSEFPPLPLVPSNIANKPQKPRISNITPVNTLSTRTSTKTHKRLYVPLLKHKEDIGEDDSIDLVDISVDAAHYIDDEAINQSYLYGSRLALQDLMQLSLRPVALIDHEIHMVTEHIKLALASDNETEHIDAILALIILCTSKGY